MKKLIKLCFPQNLNILYDIVFWVPDFFVKKNLILNFKKSLGRFRNKWEPIPSVRLCVCEQQVVGTEMLLSEYRREKHLYSQIPEDQIKLQIIHRFSLF